MHSFGYVVGFVAGCLIGLVIIGVAMKFSGTRLKGNLDERQVLAQGKAHTAGFFTLLIWCVLGFMLDEVGLMQTIGTGVFLLIGVLAGVLVFAIISIAKDAYIGITEKTGRIIVVFFVIAGINFFVGYRRISEGGIWNKAGQLSMDNTMNLFCGTALIIVIIALGIKKLCTRDQLDAD